MKPFLKNTIMLGRWLMQKSILAGVSVGLFWSVISILINGFSGIFVGLILGCIFGLKVFIAGFILETGGRFFVSDEEYEKLGSAS